MSNRILGKISFLSFSLAFFQLIRTSTPKNVHRSKKRKNISNHALIYIVKLILMMDEFWHYLKDLLCVAYMVDFPKKKYSFHLKFFSLVSLYRGCVFYSHQNIIWKLGESAQQLSSWLQAPAALLLEFTFKAKPFS